MIFKKYFLAIFIVGLLAVLLIGLSITNSLIDQELKKASADDPQVVEHQEHTVLTDHQEPINAGVKTSWIDPNNDLLAPMKKKKEQKWIELFDPVVSETIASPQKTPFLVQ